jgi:hypothetical protein
MPDLLKSPSVDQLVSPTSVDDLVAEYIPMVGDVTFPILIPDSDFISSYQFVGAVVFPNYNLFVEGHYDNPVGKNFTAGITFPIFDPIAGAFNRVIHIEPSAVTFPPWSGDLQLLSPSADQLTSNPTDDDLILRRQFVRATFTTQWDFVGAVVFPVLLPDGTLALAPNTATGGVEFPTILPSGVFDTSNPLFAGAVNLPVLQISGIYTHTDTLFTGAINFPVLVPSGVKGGRDAQVSGIVFMNSTTQNFDNAALNAIIDKLTPPATGEGAGEGAFDDINQLTGEVLGGPGFRSVNVRSPRLENTERPQIDPKILTFMSKKRRTHVSKPALFEISMTWDLFPCGSADFLFTLIGLIYFQQAIFVDGDDTWLLTLLDDVEELIYAARQRNDLTLNFEGRKL